MHACVRVFLPVHLRSYVFLLFQQEGGAVGAAHAKQLVPPERNSFNVRAPPPMPRRECFTRMTSQRWCGMVR
jgi:hypothetical protein